MCLGVFWGMESESTFFPVDDSRPGHGKPQRARPRGNHKLHKRTFKKNHRASGKGCAVAGNIPKIIDTHTFASVGKLFFFSFFFSPSQFTNVAPVAHMYGARSHTSGFGLPGGEKKPTT